METLIDKISVVEQEAAERISQAQKQGKQSLQDLLSSEEQLLKEVRERADGRAKQIIQERVRQAKGDLNLLKQEQEKSVAMAHEAATKNRQHAVASAIKLFEKDFLS